MVQRLQDVLVSQNGRQFVDFARFHETLPIDEKPPPQTLQGKQCSSARVSIMHPSQLAVLTNLHPQFKALWQSACARLEMVQGSGHCVQRRPLLT